MTTTWQRNMRIVWIAELLAIMGFSSTFPIYTYFIQYLGVEDHLIARWSGAVIALSSISMGLLGPVWGALGDRHGRKVMVMRAMFGGAIIIGLQGFSQNVWQFAVLRLIQGALTGTVTAATALVASNTPRERLGETLGKFQLAIFLGQAFGPTTGGFVADTLGYRATFWLTAGYLIIAGGLILFGVQEDFEPAAEASQGSIWERMRQDIGMIFAGSLLGLVLGLRFALRVGLRVAGPTMPLIVQELMPGSALLGAASGLLSTVSGISSAIAAPTVGRWADRGDSRRLLVGSAMLAAVAMVIQAVAPNYWVLVTGQFVLGLGVGGTLSVISAYVGRMAPKGRVGTAFGLDALAVSLSNAVGPAAGGWLSDTVSRRSPLIVGAVATALAGLAVLRLPAATEDDTAPEAVDAEPARAG
ncbi:MAG: MFS transporter [Anaerolineae bacterium]|nr:MFS transporter [Anaerolineae bacterium]